MPNRLSIVLLSREYPPFFGGGIGTATAALAGALAEAGERVTVITVGGGDGQEVTGAPPPRRVPSGMQPDREGGLWVGGAGAGRVLTTENRVLSEALPDGRAICFEGGGGAGGGVTVVRLPFLAVKGGPREGGRRADRGGGGGGAKANTGQEDWSRLHPSITNDATRGVFESGHFWRGSAWAWRVAQELPGLCERFGFDVIEVPDTGALAWFALAMRQAGVGLGRTRGGGCVWGARGVGIAALDWPAIVTCVHSPSAWISELNREPREEGRAGTRAMRTLEAMERESVRWCAKDGGGGGVCCPSGPLARWTERWAGLEGGGGGVGAIERVGYALGELEAVARRTVMDVESRDARARHVGAEASRRMLFIGRLEYRKGIDTLLEAWRSVCEAMPGVRLTLAGADTADPVMGGRLGERLLRGVGIEARRTIEALGRQRPEAIQRLLSEHGIVVVASPDDNLPYTMIEAMCHGRVVVASRAGGMGETIRDGVDGLLFEPGDSADLARVLRRAMAMSAVEQRQMGARAAARALELFGNKRIARERVAFYERAIERWKEQRSSQSPATLHARAVRDNDHSGIGDERGVRLIGTSVKGEVATQIEAALRLALEANADAYFAHGWTRTPDGRVHAFVTPTMESLADSPRHMGPIAVRAAALERLVSCGIPHRLETCATGGGWGLARALLAAGCRGIVVPGVISAVSAEAEDASVPMADPREVKPALVARVRGKLGRAMAAVRGTGRERARDAGGEAS